MSDGLLDMLRHPRARYSPHAAYNEALDDAATLLRSDQAVTVLRDVATAHALVPNGIVPGSFFEERRKCVVCGEVDDPDHPIRMGLAALAGGDDGG